MAKKNQKVAPVNLAPPVKVTVKITKEMISKWRKDLRGENNGLDRSTRCPIAYTLLVTGWSKPAISTVRLEADDSMDRRITFKKSKDVIGFINAVDDIDKAAPKPCTLTLIEDQSAK